MRKFLSRSALASAALLTAVASLPASAAGLSPNIAVGHVVVRPMNNNIAASNQYFTPNGHIPHQGPEYQKKWVCGPIVNYDGTPHCHWVDIIRTY